jgi:hypothetical protein
MFKKEKLLFNVYKLYKSLQKTNMKNILDVLKKNWKTTAAGVVLAIVAVLINKGALTPEQGTLITTILSALGFVVAKDGNVSGGSNSSIN